MEGSIIGLLLISISLLAQENAPPPTIPVPTELLNEQQIPAPQPSPVSTQGPIPSIPKEDYVYDPTGRRDPFMVHKSFQKRDSSIITSRPSGKGSPVLPEPTEPLLKVDLEKLLLIGIIWEVVNPRALVVDGGDSAKKVHIISKHTKIGRHNGYVAAIREGEIVIIESYEDEGVINEMPKIIKLQTSK